MSIQFKVVVKAVQAYHIDENGKPCRNYKVFKDEVASFDLGNWSVLRSILPENQAVGIMPANPLMLTTWLEKARTQLGAEYHTWEACTNAVRTLWRHWHQNKHLYITEDESFCYELEIEWG